MVASKAQLYNFTLRHMPLPDITCILWDASTVVLDWPASCTTSDTIAIRATSLPDCLGLVCWELNVQLRAFASGSARSQDILLFLAVPRNIALFDVQTSRYSIVPACSQGASVLFGGKLPPFALLYTPSRHVKIEKHNATRALVHFAKSSSRLIRTPIQASSGTLSGRSECRWRVRCTLKNALDVPSQLLRKRGSSVWDARGTHFTMYTDQMALSGTSAYHAYDVQ
ncbi:hypothetical protein B0H34DRAFT_671644 [Crassisporium funariophilum]|nr:hypothetical protein B0H34DRAFT_671644 [Crassisporium funariophilum]